MSESSILGARRIELYLDGEGIVLTPVQVEQVRLRIESTEGEAMIRVLVEIRETLRGMSKADGDNAVAMADIAAALTSLRAPIERVFSAEERSITTRVDLVQRVVIPVLAALGSAGVTWFFTGG